MIFRAFNAMKNVVYDLYYDNVYASSWGNNNETINDYIV